RHLLQLPGDGVDLHQLQHVSGDGEHAASPGLLVASPAVVRPAGLHAVPTAGIPDSRGLVSLGRLGGDPGGCESRPGAARVPPPAGVLSPPCRLSGPLPSTSARVLTLYPLEYPVLVR